jgi:hypothetical protein
MAKQNISKKKINELNVTAEEAKPTGKAFSIHLRSRVFS